ncbi:hypothetical protein [Candidatus Magnetomonas plexicatena]|uniref:hypothetical protein n=1 Tax=Candidatus Magnetomonas plexicatena TaxID=2552947 RepID=UPI001C7521DC|nr:hypothetical protein E2O03_004910 [Nitrospirales bacterium LBB_01]
MDSFDIPFWPQLPQTSFMETMVAQYSEGLPCLEIDSVREQYTIKRKSQDELNNFYEKYSENPSIAISEGNAAGFHKMISLLKTKERFDTLKGHVTGPLTFTLGIKDEAGRFLFFDEELREIALMLLIGKVKWQVEALKKYADNVVIFIDEPIFTAIGSSSYLGVSREESGRLITEIVNGIQSSGAIAGIHTCGKCDWDIVFDAKPDIVNFDSYAFFDTIAMYHERITKYLSEGGTLAWGMVPTTNFINYEDESSIIKKFDERLNSLAKNVDRDLILSHLMLTPSCGAGALTVPEAEKVFRLLKALKGYLVETYGN